MTVERPDTDARGARDFLQAGACRLLGEHRLGRFEQALAIALGIDRAFRTGLALALAGTRDLPLDKRRVPPYM